jgi:hypothetical protein
MLLGRDTFDKTNGFEQKHRTCLPQSALPLKTSKLASYSAAQRFTATHQQLSRGIASRILHETPRSELAKNNTKHICKTEVTNTAHVHNITHILHLLIAPRFHQRKEATTILRKMTIRFGPYRSPAET